MDESRLYPIGQQNFRELRKDGCLFLSTLRYYFEGQRDLFKGAIKLAKL